MDFKTFQHEMAKAQAFITAEERPNYWSGYRRGLRRQYHGDNFETEEAHQLWLTMTGDPDRDERSAGYRAGFNFSK